MRSLRDLAIKQKMMIAIMLTTAAALVWAGLGMVVTDSVLFRALLRRDLSALTEILADNCTAALSYNDPKAAEQTLVSLRARPHVVSACVHRSDGSTLACYIRPGGAAPPLGAGYGVRFTEHSVVAAQPVVFQGRQVGTLVLLYDLGEISERIVLYGATVCCVLLISAMLALPLSAGLRRVVTAPISQLVHAATFVSETGDYRMRAKKISSDELGFLVDRFNEMLAGIQSRDEALKRERERFRFLAESMPQKIFTTTPDGAVDYLNQQWMEYTGLPFDQMKGWSWTRLVHPDDVEGNVNAWRRSLDTGEPFLFEQRFRRADGKYRWHLSRAHAMRDAGGEVSLWIGSNTDIHERKEEEQALRRANDDLQQFAYAASHDLQEPIRNVAVYSGVVADRYRDSLDDEGRLFLGFLRESGQRLSMLVNDLLAYTRAGAGEVADSEVDSEDVLRYALASLSEAMRESGAEIAWDLLPRVCIGEAHLQQVLQNLVGNALKYRDARPPRIRISAASQGREWLFSVADNGIGIEPQYREKIFGVFKRLHHDRSYSGTGIGLAICKRVLERYGGRIWVESEPGAGSTFYFTVPQRARAGGAEELAAG
ncbi:MAG TPA: ATP-binding protein [Bryobacteraceae bacterium]|nr:ATP-binding protein [Bryobacteraceae bacterium]